MKQQETCQKTKLTSDSNKLGQFAVVYYYCRSFHFFLNQTLAVFPRLHKDSIGLGLFCNDRFPTGFWQMLIDSIIDGPHSKWIRIYLENNFLIFSFAALSECLSRVIFSLSWEKLGSWWKKICMNCLGLSINDINCFTWLLDPSRSHSFLHCRKKIGDLQSIDWTIHGFGFLLVANYKPCLVKAKCSKDGIIGISNNHQKECILLV